MLRNANLSYTQVGGLPYFKGEHVDFTYKWYMETAPLIIETMIFIAFFPVLNFIWQYSRKWVMRAIDRGSCCGKNITTKVSTI